MYYTALTLKASGGRRIAFWYALSWFAILLLLALLYARGKLDPALSGIPLAAVASMWAGALGGVAISLKGVYDHWADASQHPQGKTAWNNELLLWHLGRPVSGAIVGLAVFMVFQAAYPSGTPSAGALAAASFVLGLQEKRFFEWVKQVGAALITIPGKQGVSARSDTTNAQIGVITEDPTTVLRTDDD
jgi:hypothetical protein